MTMKCEEHSLERSDQLAARSINLEHMFGMALGSETFVASKVVTFDWDGGIVVLDLNVIQFLIDMELEFCKIFQVSSLVSTKMSPN